MVKFDRFIFIIGGILDSWPTKKTWIVDTHNRDTIVFSGKKTPFFKSIFYHLEATLEHMETYIFVRISYHPYFELRAGSSASELAKISELRLGVVEVPMCTKTFINSTFFKFLIHLFLVIHFTFR